MKIKAKPHQKKSIVNQVAQLTHERRKIFALARDRIIPIRVAIHNMRALDSERRSLLT